MGPTHECKDIVYGIVLLRKPLPCTRVYIEMISWTTRFIYTAENRPRFLSKISSTILAHCLPILLSMVSDGTE